MCVTGEGQDLHVHEGEAPLIHTGRERGKKNSSGEQELYISGNTLPEKSPRTSKKKNKSVQVSFTYRFATITSLYSLKKCLHAVFCKHY